jgi:OOP family OmpA-OmpF porin
MSRKALLAAAAIAILPATAHSQPDWFRSTYQTYPGFYIGAQGGLNWLLNARSPAVLR